ncbi:MAG: metallophosphoesterase [Puniceicoccales bacterium]|nr:metallophosphoesterase [Puniceicoccales bacterium]
MNRRNFLATTATLGVLTPLGSAQSLGAAPGAPARQGGGAPKAPAGSQSPLAGTPAVFAPAADGFTVVTTLDAPALVRVQYGEAPADGQIPPEADDCAKLLNQTAASDGYGFVPHDDRVVQIRVHGLRAGTRHLWRLVATPLGSADKAPRYSKVYSTRTLDPAAASTRFLVWNDTHDRAPTICGLHNRSRLSAFAPGETPDFLLWNGDLCNNVNHRAQLPHLFVSPKDADLAGLPPVFVARGNHDVRGIWSNKVPDYVAFPGNRPYYAFRSGPVAAIVLDTGEDKPDNHPSFGGVAAFEPLIREQAAWLDEVVLRPEFRDAPHRVVFCHIPLRWLKERKPDYSRHGYDDFSRRGREAWAGALRRWGAQVVISGHMHHAAKIPANNEWPFEQIVGGGPALTGNPKGATLLRGYADARCLRLEIAALAEGGTGDNPLFHSEFAARAWGSFFAL